MIDASRLSHSLATALKDRPHGIPVQPNRSLPLRPLPPPPTRNLHPKSTNDLQSPGATGNEDGNDTQNIGQQEDNMQNASKATYKQLNDGVAGFRAAEMNFYDSRGNEIDNPKIETDNVRGRAKELAKYRHTKSLDHSESVDSTSGGVNRRKSYESGKITRDGEGKKMTSYRSDRSPSDCGGQTPGDQDRLEITAKKRKLSSTGEVNNDLSRLEKASKIQTTDAVVPPIKLKVTSRGKGDEPVWYNTNINELDSTVSEPSLSGVESSDDFIQTIYKFRTGIPNALQTTGTNTKSMPSENCGKLNCKNTVSNHYKFMMPKPQSIPKCPAAVPIEIARAINQAEASKPKIKAHKDDTDNLKKLKHVVPQMANERNVVKPKITTEKSDTCTPKNNLEINHTLPSMPSLEDALTDFHRAKLITSSTDDQTSDPPTEATNLVPIEPTAKDINSPSVEQYNQPVANDSNAYVTAVLKIEIPGRLPELMIVPAPPLPSSGSSVAGTGPAEAMIPMCIPSNVQPAIEEPRKTEEFKEMENRTIKVQDKNSVKLQNTYTGVIEEIVLDQPTPETLVSLPHSIQQQCQDLSANYQTQASKSLEETCDITETLEDIETDDEEPGEITEGSQDDPNTVSNIVRSRKIRRKIKLQKLHREEARLKRKMNQTNDPSRLMRLQQRLNCATKKIENIQKALEMLSSIEHSRCNANPVSSRIQVRRDLLQDTPPPESAEPTPQSLQRPTDKSDEALIGKSPTVAPPIVITIIESETSSNEETDTSDVSSLAPVAPQHAAEVEHEVKSIPVIKFVNSENNLTTADCEKVQNILEKPLTPDLTDRQLVQRPVTDQPAVLSSDPTITNNNVEDITLRNSTVIRNPTNCATNSTTVIVDQKLASAQFGSQNLNSTSDKFEKRPANLGNNYLLFVQDKSAIPTDSLSHVDTNNLIPTTVSDLRTPITIQRTASHEHANTHPAPNNPVHCTDYATTGNTTSMFSRDNGGAHINLSSPLQGHSALPLPVQHNRNLTAQGYPTAAEPSPAHQKTQSFNQHPGMKASVPLAPEQSTGYELSMLATLLQTTLPQEPADLSSVARASNSAPSKNETHRNMAQNMNTLVTNTQFPTLGSFAAQMDREPSTATNPPRNVAAASANVQQTVDNGHKTTGSDLYKMTATAVDTRIPMTTPNTVHWIQNRHWSEQQGPATFHQVQNRNQLYPCDYPQANPQQFQIPQQLQKPQQVQNSQNPRNHHNAPVGYSRSQVFVPCATQPHIQSAARPKNIQSAEHPQSQIHPQYQNPPPYQVPQSSSQHSIPAAHRNQNQASMSHPVYVANQIHMAPQQYLQQASPSSMQAVYSQWNAVNQYHASYNYMGFNGYNIQPKPQNNSPCCQVPSKNNVAPAQQHTNVTPTHTVQNIIGNAKVPIPRYNTQTVFKTTAQNPKANKPLDPGIAYRTPHPGNVNQSTNRASNLKCSRCGLLGAQFNCIDCESAFYCNERCQAQHWMTHFMVCPKKMPKLKKVR